MLWEGGWQEEIVGWMNEERGRKQREVGEVVASRN